MQKQPYRFDYSGNFPVPIWVNIVRFLKDIFAGVGGGLLGTAKAAFSVASKIPQTIKLPGGFGTLNPAHQSALTNATNLQYAGGLLKGTGIAAQVVSYGLLALDVGLSIYNNVTNPNLSTSRKVTDSIIDVGLSVGSFLAVSAVGAKIGAGVGTLIGGPIGTIIGAAAGAIVGIGIGVYFFQQSQLYRGLKVGFNTFMTQTIPNAWNNFWSFGWAR